MVDGNNILKNYSTYKEFSIQGRYIHFDSISRLLKKNKSSVIGYSELNVPIHSITTGSGNKKILIWSQMHGNESTGTKALFDVLNILNDSSLIFVNKILKNCSVEFIPILNPDGAQLYTRENANGIDLNRDAVDLKAKESQILRSRLDSFMPHFCFNLHDQRTIFGVGGTKNSAVLSFLAPSTEESRAITESRITTMNVISAMNKELQKHIPNYIGRYTDEFYPTATGDNFQKMGFHTILIESGHYPKDYEREISRKYTFLSIISGLYHIATSNTFNTVESYFDIPNNEKIFYDIIHRYTSKPDEAYQYKETLKNGKIELVLEKVQNFDAKNHFGHKEIVFVD